MNSVLSCFLNNDSTPLLKDHLILSGKTIWNVDLNTWPFVEITVILKRSTNLTSAKNPKMRIL